MPIFSIPDSQSVKSKRNRPPPSKSSIAYISGGLNAFSIDGVESQKVVDYVRDKYNIVIRTVGSRVKGTWIRVSTPIYVSYSHVDMLLEGVQRLVKHKS